MFFSNLVTIPQGCNPADVLVASPVVSEGAGMMGTAGGFGDGGVPGGQTGAAPGGGGMDDFGGVDPNMDPELAMALRVSMEEERARQEQEASAPAAPTTEPLSTVPESLEPEPLLQPQFNELNIASDSTPTNAMDDDDVDDDELLQQALALSMHDAASSDTAPVATPETTQPAMEVETPATSASTQPPAAAAQTAAAPQYDSDFVNNLLASLPGVDPSDPRIQTVLQQIQDKQDKDEKDKK